ncbi:MAG: DUF448 domain-containing protein [Deltaproteobacteria bacterium]
MKHKAFPVRTCIVCGRQAPKMELRRMVLGERSPVSDWLQRLPGRGAYVCAHGSCGKTPARGGVKPFCWAFRTKVLWDEVSDLWAGAHHT